MSVLSRGMRCRVYLPNAAEAIVLLGASAATVVLALILIHISAAAAIAVALVPPAVWLLTRSYGGLSIGIALILVVPYWYTFGSGQLTTLRLASAAAAFTLLVKRRFRFHLIDYALLMVVAVMVADWLLLYNQPQAGRILSIELTPLGFYFGARAIPPSRIRQILLLALTAGTVGALTVIYEYAHGSARFVDPTTYVWNATGQFLFRPGGVFGSPPGASTVLCLLILLGIPCTLEYTGRIRTLSVACLSVCCIALVLTFTRAAMIAVAVGFIIILWLIRSQLLRPLRIAWIVAAVAVALGLVSPALQKTTVFQEGVLRAGTLAQRESYWADALPVATSNVQHLVFGFGTGSLEAPSVASAAPIRSIFAATPQIVDNSLHSQYVTMLLEQGLIGVAALIFFLVTAAGSSGVIAYRSRDPVAAALSASVAAAAIIMSVDTSLLQGPSFAVLLLVVGLSASITRPPTRHVDGGL